MKDKLMIIGSSGHGKVIEEIAEKYYKKIFFLDDDKLKRAVGPVSDFKKYIDDYDFIVAIGDNKIREKITNELVNASFATLIHPKAIVSSKAIIGKGSVVMAGAIINTSAQIGEGVILNTASSIDHDCKVDDYCHISVGSHLAGGVTIGKRCFICAGAIVINNINICDDTIVGAGATVIDKINQPGVYVGTPAKKIVR